MKATTTKTILNVFVTNLSAYNDGKLIGEWLSLPATNEEINDLFDRIGVDNNFTEYFITDSESDFDINVNEYDSIDDLNDIAEKLNDLEDYEVDTIAFLMRELDRSYTIDEILEKVDDVHVFFDCYDWTDIAREFMAETGELDQLPEWAQNYFDFESYGRDLKFDAYTYDFTNGNAYVLWNW